ncbi:MDR family MFS transporter [Nocardia sp. NPDC004604]|uniref:MDR family MFS transporter n=1 Tax=Nocardia sp. NPDC004604 TaxID=3157013 RepID=UPI0033A00C91
MTSGDDTFTANGGFSHRQIVTMLLGLALGMFLASLDQTVVAVSIRTIADDLHGFSMMAWCTTAYLIASVMVTPLYGKLSDMYGRKRLYLTAITVFIAGSLLCSLATSIYQLAAFRTIQGLGAGGLLSLSMTIIGDIVSPRERARYTGILMAVLGIATMIGPLLGGVLSGQAHIMGIAGWRWVFVLNVPTGLVAVVVLARVLNLLPKGGGRRRIDWWGVVALTVGVTPLLVVAEQGRTWGWGSVKSLTCFIIGTLGLLVFCAVETRMGESAIVPLRLFRNRIFAQGVVISFVAGATMFGAIALLPQYLQVVRGASPTMAGVQAMPMMVGMMIGSIVTARLIYRSGRYRIFPIIGSFLLTLALFLSHYMTPDSRLWTTMILMAVIGCGLGCLMQPITLASQNAVEPEDMAVATGSLTFFQQIGGTAGIAVLLSVLFSVMPGHLRSAVESAALTPEFSAAVVADAHSADPAVQRFAQSMTGNGADQGGTGSVMDDTSLIQKLEPALSRPLKQGFNDSLSVAFLLTSAMALLGLLLALTWREVPLRQTSGIQAVRASGEARA